MTAIIDSEMLWRQFGAAIDTFGQALRDCPDELWEAHLWEDQPDQWVAKGFSTFWYLSYHTLFWLDLYLTGSEEGFVPPAPFDLVEMKANEVLPRVYSRAELLGYLETCRLRCQETIFALSEEGANRMCSFAWGELPFAELQLYNLRHVQEHAAQLHLFLGQKAWKDAGWVSRAGGVSAFKDVIPGASEGSLRLLRRKSRYECRCLSAVLRLSLYSKPQNLG